MSKFRVELRDRQFNILDILDNEYTELSWSYSRIGGCGGFSFKLPRRLFEEKNVSGTFNIRIYYRNPSTDTYDIWYQGFIQNKTPFVRGNTEDIQIDGHGYYAQLKNIYVNTSYASQEVSVIVKDVLDTYITPNTNISYQAADIEATTYTPDSITFNDYGDAVMQKLADLVGTREYGVDSSRNFFFKARSTSVGRQFYLNKNLHSFTENQDFSDIFNRVYVQGAQAGGTSYFSAATNHLPSQAKYGIIDRVIQNSSVTTDAVAAQLSTSALSESNDVSRKASFKLVNLEAQLEATNPIDLINVIKKQTRYGQKRYGTFLYAGNVNRVVNRLNYTVTDANTLEIDVDCGQLRPDIVEQLSQLTYNLEQNRASSV